MALKWITGKVTNPDGTAAAGADIRFVLSQACTIPGTQEIVPSTVDLKSDVNGVYSTQLQANDDMTPTGGYYTKTTNTGVLGGARTATIVVSQTTDGHGHAGASLVDAMIDTWLETNPPTIGASPSHVSSMLVDGASTFGGASIHPPQTPTQAVLVSGIDASLSEEIQVTLTANRVMGVPLNGVPGQRLHMVITEGGAGGFALTFGAGITVTNFGLNMGVGSKTDAYLTCISAGQWVIWSPSVSGQAITPSSVTAVPPGSPNTPQTLASLSTINLEAWAHPPSGDTTGATDYGNLQADINALPAGWTLKLWLGLYYINAALTIPGNCTLRGGGVSEVYGAFTPSHGTVTPGASPWLTGTVIVQVTAATNGIAITGTGLNVHLQGFGIRFADAIAFNNTGHGVYAVPTATTGGRPENGLAGGRWSNLIVFGHDGNHYGFYTVNKTVFSARDLHTYGGGGWYQESNSAVNSYGCGQVDGGQFVLLAGGTANVVHLKARQSGFPGQIVTMVFNHPVAYLWDITGQGYGLAAAFSIPTPLNTQALWLEENTPQDVILMQPDLQLSGTQLGPITFGFDTVCVGLNKSGTNVVLPAFRSKRAWRGTPVLTFGSGSGSSVLGTGTIDAIDGGVTVPNDERGKVHLNVGTNPFGADGAMVCKLTLQAWVGIGGVMLAPFSANLTGVQFGLYVKNLTANSFEVWSHIGLTASTSYEFLYHVIE